MNIIVPPINTRRDSMWIETVGNTVLRASSIDSVSVYRVEDEGVWRVFATQTGRDVTFTVSEHDTREDALNASVELIERIDADSVDEMVRMARAADTPDAPTVTREVGYRVEDDRTLTEYVEDHIKDAKKQEQALRDIP